MQIFLSLTNLASYFFKTSLYLVIIGIYMCSAVYTDVHMDILMDSSSTYIGIFYCAGNGKYMYKKPTFQGKLSTICSMDSKPQSFNSTKPWKRTHTKYRFFKHLNDEMKTVTVTYYQISDMIPVALPPRLAGDGLTRSLFILCIVQYIVYLIWLV